jgi:hypothetical protein
MRTPLLSAVLSITLLALAGCGTYKSAATFDDPNGNFHLRVYMDSYRYAVVPMDLKVWIDGRVAVDRNFSSSKGHYSDQFRFTLAPGTHTLKAASNKGNATIERSFEMGDRTFAALYFTPKSEAGPGGFDFRVSDEPIYAAPGGGIQ